MHTRSLSAAAMRIFFMHCGAFFLSLIFGIGIAAAAPAADDPATAAMNDAGPMAAAQGSGERLQNKVNPGGISIEDSWSWNLANGFSRIQVAKLVNRRNGGVSSTLRLEVWATSTPYTGGTLSGYKISQVVVGTLTAGFQFTNLDYTVPQLVTPPNGTWYMTMVAAEFTNDNLNDGFTIADWEQMSPAWVLGQVVQYITVIEFYNFALNHYFRTANASEAAAVDAGAAGPGWVRTNDNFIAFLRSAFPAGAFEVCRFYGSVSPGPNSHFYTASVAECQNLKNIQAITSPFVPRWNYEEIAFAVDLPTNGICPARSPTRVYRAYNNRFAQNDSNHRYTTSLAALNQLVLQGWSSEGLVMCAG